MRYLLLLNNDAERVEQWRNLSAEEAARERAKEIPRWGELFAWAAEHGLELRGLELSDPQTARVLTRRNGKTIVSDGPFAETKEVLGGYFVVDCDHLDRAIEIAARVPVAASGSVEIRPVAE